MAVSESASRDLPAKRDEGTVAWRGDEHRLRREAAHEAGLISADVELDFYTEGFKAGLTIEDPFDGAIVARGRTVLDDKQLALALWPALRYLGVSREDTLIRVHEGDFEVRLAKRAAEASNPALDSAKLALQVWLGFGLLGWAAYVFLPMGISAIVWGLGLLLGGWQLRRGLASGRAMLSARFALALGMLAHEEQLILPPAGDRPGPSR